MTQEKGSSLPTAIKLDRETLRQEISKEYAVVASNPDKGFHFHTGKFLAKRLGYNDSLVETLPAKAVKSFAGTGTPFSLGDIVPGEKVVDVGSGTGFDSLIAAGLVAPTGKVIGVDMTESMLNKAREASAESGLDNVEFRNSHAESLPVPDEWADVVISNGMINLCPDKSAVFAEIYRVLRPGGRIQIGDIVVEKPVPDESKENIDLWTG